MIKINLTDGYYIIIKNGVEHTLCRDTDRTTTDKKGVTRPAIDMVGYYTSLDNAVGRYIACACDSVSVSDLDSIKEYAELIDKTCTTAITAITRLIRDGGLVEAQQLEKDYSDLKRRYNRVVELMQRDDESDDCYED